MLLKRLAKYFAVLLLFNSYTISPSAAAIIDDFSVGPVFYSLGVNDSLLEADQTELDPNHVIGGTRSFRLSKLPGVPRRGGSVEISDGVLAYRAAGNTFDDGLESIRIRYGSASNPLNFNLVGDGSDQLLIAFEEYDVTSMDLLIRADLNISGSIISRSRIFGIVNPPPYNVVDFVHPIGLNAFGTNSELQNLQSLSVTFISPRHIVQPSRVSSFKINYIATNGAIPEPPAAVMAILCFVLMVSIHRLQRLK